MRCLGNSSIPVNNENNNKKEEEEPKNNINQIEDKEKKLKEQQETVKKGEEIKEQEEIKKKENEQNKKEPVIDDEKSGSEVRSHNKKIPEKADLERFQRDALKRHNYYRKYHQSVPMELTQKLNDYAQQYAETLAEKDEMQHSTKEEREKIYGDWTGENLYYFWTSQIDLTITGAAAVDDWYDEIKDYDFQNGKSKNGGVVGHFTQVLWKDSTQLGIGVAKSSKNSVYVVGNYHPGGNFNNNELKNVFPAKA